MDKSHFITTAPKYYALAVAIFFDEKSSGEVRDIVELFEYTDEYEVNTYQHLRNNALLAEAMTVVVSHGLVDVMEDDFGPTILVRRESFEDGWESIAKSYPEVFSKYAKLGSGARRWLHTALDSLNEKYDELGITDEDFNRPDQEWQPLPLDRTEPALKKAIEKIDETIGQVKGDNGYAVHVPGERALVIDALSKSSERLKQDEQTSLGYLRENTFGPLLRLVKRFGAAALGVSASAAAKALIDFIQTSVGSVVTHALRRLFGLE